MPQTMVYIDGFNLYYGMLRRSPYKWLDVVKLFTDPIPEAPQLKTVQVYSFDEKKTDVSLATDLVNGAWRGDYQQAVV
jgi:hypothetical protein